MHLQGHLISLLSDHEQVWQPYTVDPYYSAIIMQVVAVHTIIEYVVRSFLPNGV